MPVRHSNLHSAGALRRRNRDRTSSSALRSCFTLWRLRHSNSSVKISDHAYFHYPSQFHLLAGSDTIDINIVCQLCNQTKVLPGFTFFPIKVILSKVNIMDTYFLLSVTDIRGSAKPEYRRLIPECSQMNIIDLPLATCLCISAEQNLDIKQLLFRLLYPDISVMDVMYMTAICLMDRNCRTAHISFVLTVNDITILKYKIVDLTLEAHSLIQLHCPAPHSRVRCCGHIPSSHPEPSKYPQSAHGP